MTLEQEVISKTEPKTLIKPPQGDTPAVGEDAQTTAVRFENKTLRNQKKSTKRKRKVDTLSYVKIKSL